MPLVWEPPPPARPSNRWQDTIDALRSRPGEWARIAEPSPERVAASTSSHLRRYYKLETATRKIDGEGWAVWARCPGEKVPGIATVFPQDAARTIESCPNTRTFHVERSA